LTVTLYTEDPKNYLKNPERNNTIIIREILIVIKIISYLVPLVIIPGIIFEKQTPDQLLSSISQLLYL